MDSTTSNNVEKWVSNRKVVLQGNFQLTSAEFGRTQSSGETPEFVNQRSSVRTKVLATTALGPQSASYTSLTKVHVSLQVLE